MRWINGETFGHKHERCSEWHRWFAWHPVRIGEENGHWIKAWLEWVGRKGYYRNHWNGWTWQYRDLTH